MVAPFDGRGQGAADNLKDKSMGWLAKVRMRLGALRHGEEVHGEIAEEWQFHIDLRTEENIRRGMTPKEARRSAEQHFGNAGYIKDVSWDVRGGGVMETVWQDVRFGIRQLRRSPGFTFVAVLSLGLGIGGNALIFSLISTILLRPLPISDPEQVFAIHQGRERDASYSQSMSYPNYKDIRDRNAVLSGMGVYRFDPMSLSHNGSNERVWGYLVSGNYFDVLGVQAFLGRTFTADEDRTPNSHPVAVLSYGCWRRFGGEPGIVGSSIQINGHSFTTIGVAPPGFTGTESIFTPELWVPSMMQEWIETGSGLEGRADGQWLPFGRLKRGTTAEQAKAQLNTVARQLGQEYPKTDEGMTLRLTPPGLVDPNLRSAVIAFSSALMLTVLLVLLIACTNLASLLLARATQRRKEIAVRMAIGATRARLALQLLTESVMLSVTGAAFGLAIGQALILVARVSLPRTDFALTLDLRMDWRVVSFVVALAVVTGIGFGLVPALKASRSDVVYALKEDTSGGRRRAWLRGVLVVTEVALSFVLLITAGLTVRSLEHTEGLGPGFDPNSAVTMSVDLGLQGYDEKSGENFYQLLVEHVRALPGVKSAGWIARLPLALDVSTTGVYPDGQAEPRAEEMPSAIYESVSPDYFETMGIPIVGGRDFAGSDTAKSPGVVIVNETLAERFWPSQNAVGKRLHSGKTDVLEVVGVAKNGKYQSLGEIPALVVYYPLTQSYATSAALVIRTSVDPRAEISSVRSEGRKLDPQLPIYDAKTLEEHMRLALFPLHAGAVAAGSFALLAMTLAAIGIYGVMAYSVGQRTHEIGIRMALGARASDVWKMVLKQGVIITAIGMVFGLVCAIGLSGVVASMLYGVSATDPLTFLFITLLLAAVALAACYIPARRATKVDPLIAIRSL
jgi:macrolide transport system ATP-binding/permease protein